MNTTEIAPSGRIVEEQLDCHLAAIQKAFGGADALAFIGPRILAWMNTSGMPLNGFIEILNAGAVIPVALPPGTAQRDVPTG